MEVERNLIDQARSLIDSGMEAGIYDQVDSGLTAAALLSIVEDWYLKSSHFKQTGLRATAYGDFAVSAAHRLLGFRNGDRKQS